MLLYNNKDNQLLLHIFIQWLAHKGILDEWIDEMLNEYPSEGFTVEKRIERLTNRNNSALLIQLGFGGYRTKAGRSYWLSIQKDWKAYHSLHKSFIEAKFSSAAASLAAYE